VTVQDVFGLDQSRIINLIEINKLGYDVIAKVSQLCCIMLKGLPKPHAHI
jgi:hypothetical protein